MLISQEPGSELQGRHGCRPVSLAVLRRQLARPSQMDSSHRQRLLELAQRLARVQDLGGEYRRVSLSEEATAAAQQTATIG